MSILSFYRWVMDRNISVCFQELHLERFFFFSKLKGRLHDVYPHFWHPVIVYFVVVSMRLSSKKKRIQGCFIFMLRKWIVTRDTQLGMGPWAWLWLQWSCYPALTKYQYY